jgi:hypothetical protein
MLVIVTMMLHVHVVHVMHGHAGGHVSRKSIPIVVVVLVDIGRKVLFVVIGIVVVIVAIRHGDLQCL